MLKIYYTTTAGEDEAKQKASTSLGGYRSSTEIPNSLEGNLFGEISSYTISVNKPNYIGLVLKNTSTTQNAENVYLWFDSPENAYSSYKVSAVEMTTTDDGDYLANVANKEAKPYYADFYSAEGEENKVDLGTINAGESLGIWIERSLIIDNIDSVLDDAITYNATTERWEETELDSQESIEVQVDFDLVDI